MTQLSFGTVAPTSRRAVAYIIDALIAAGIGIVLAILLFVIAFAAGPEGMLGAVGVGAPVIWLVLLGWFVFYTFMQAGNGSIGMRAQGLRLVRDADGAPLGFGKALLRNIIFGLSAAIVVGYFTPLFDGSGRFQGWHDKVAGSLMLDARAGGAAITAPATAAISVPPRPPMPGGPAQPGQQAGPTGAPPIPGLAAPTHGAPNYAPPAYSAPPADAAAPASPASPTPDDSESLDHTVRAPGRPAPAAPAPQQPAATPQAPVLPQAPAYPQSPASPTPAPISHPAAPVAGEDALIAFVPGITQDGPPPRTAPTATDIGAPPAAQPAPVTNPTPAIETTGGISDIEDTRISIPGHRLIFTWDDGTKVTVSRRTLFGRNPAPEEGAAVVSVRDETLSLSKTHFEAAAEPSGGWVMDRHSTNGTVIVRDGHRITCPPGEQVRIRLGDAIEIGDRIVTVGGYA